MTTATDRTVPHPPTTTPDRRAPRRILYVDHTASMGGGEIALLNLVRHLNCAAYVPVVVLFSDGPLRTRLEESGVETHLLPISPRIANARKDALGGGVLLRVADIVYTIGFIRRLARFMREQDVAVVHTNSLKGDIIGGFAARMARIPVIWHIRDRIEPDYLPRTVVHAFRFLCRVIPDYVVTNSAATLRTVRLPRPDRSEAVPSGIDAVFPVGVVHDGTMPEPDVTTPRAPGAPVIGLVGRISPWKGQHIFLKAASMVRRRFPAARYQIIGAALFSEQEYEREVHRLVQELDLEKSVEFLGFRNDVSAVVGGLDVLVHASTSGEPFGQVVIEGMAAGKPVVATNGGGIPEIVADGMTGLLVPMGDAESMAAAICRLLSDPAMCKRMGDFGRQRVAELFTISRTADRVQAIYDRLLGAGDTVRASGRRGAKARLRSLWPVAISLSMGLRPLPLLLTVVFTATAALLKILLLHTWNDRGPSFLTFYAAVVMSAWAGGFVTGVLSTALGAITVVAMARPAMHLIVPQESGVSKTLIFLAVGLFTSVLIELLHVSNRRARRALAEAEEERTRTAFLSGATASFAICRDDENAAKALSYSAVPRLADWCVVEWSDDEFGTRRVAAHRTPDLEPEILSPFPLPPEHPISRLMLAAQSSGMAAAGTCHPKEDGIRGDGDLFAQVGGCDSTMAIPLLVAGKVYGSILLVRGTRGKSYDNRDIDLATELAMRGGLAIEYGRLFQKALLRSEER